MKLYDVPLNTQVRVLSDEVNVPIGAPQIKKGDIVLFGHLDGMFSFCLNSEAKAVHMAGWTEVEIVKG